MIEIERSLCRVAVDALASHLLEDVLADFVTRECPTLVFDTGDFGVLHELRIKSNEFLRKLDDRR